MRIIAHRGASGYVHENTLAAFAHAVELGADGVELDVHTTADGAIVIHHDAVIPSAGPIGELTLAQIGAVGLPGGHRIPPLSAALSLLADAEVWIEVKGLPEGVDQALLALIDEGPGAARRAVHSFDHRIIHRLRRRRAELRLGALSASYLLEPVRMVAGCGADVLWQEATLIDQVLVTAMHAAGKEVIAWTADEPGEVRRLESIGVDAVCTNFPDTARNALARGRG